MAGVLQRLAREPLARFVALGALIFAADRALAARSGGTEAGDPRRIVISEGFVEGLRARHRERTGAEPTPAEEAALVRAWARDEVLEREARAASLDAGDAIVRRRLVQKIEFVIAGTVSVPEPTDDELRAWMAAHRAELATPPRTTLEHAFFSREERGERAIEDARAALERPVDPADGDPFLAGGAIGPATDARIDAVLGAGAARTIGAIDVGEQGLVEGARGAHVVRVIARVPEALPELAAVRDRVRSLWIEERRAAAAEREIDRIVAGYEIVREDAR